MEPLRGKAKALGVAIYDAESKDGASQREGFSRAFLVGLLSPEGVYVAFRNRIPAPRLAGLAPEERAIARGGCFDLFMRYLLDDATGKPFRRDRVDIYAHNGGRFDVSFLLAWCARHTDEVGCEVVSIQGRAQRVVVFPRNASAGGKRSPKRELSFVDSMMVLPMSLEAAAETFSPDLEGKLSTFDRDLHEDDPSWYRYNKQDCVALRNAIEGLRRTVEDLGGELGMTAASTAMRTFRRAFQGEPFHRNTHFPFPNLHLAKKAKGRGHDHNHDHDHDLDHDDHAAADDPHARRSRARSLSRARKKRDLSHAEAETLCGGLCTAELCPRGKHCDGACHGCLHDFVLAGYVGGRCEVFERYAPLATEEGTDGVRRAVTKSLRYYDRNSSYPASLLRPMPTGEATYVVGDEEFRRTERRHRRRGDVGFVECDVEIPDDCPIPVLPRLHDGKLKFPVGRLRGVWDVAELDLLKHPLVRGTIVRVHRAVWFRAKKRSPFHDFVLRLYEIRRKHRDLQGALLRVHADALFEDIRRERREAFFKKRYGGTRLWPTPADERAFEAEWASFHVWIDRAKVAHANVKKRDLLARLHRVRDPDAGPMYPDVGSFSDLRRYRALSELAKLLMNSLYGKFGMQREREELVFIAAHDEPPAHGKPLGGRDHETSLVWRVPKFVDPAYIIPQIAAHTTALSRVALAEVMLDVVGKGGRVFYCDTDSCLCDVELSPELVDHARLGAWKEEDPDEILSGEFVLPKMYMLRRHDPSDPERVLSHVVHVKGIGRRAQTAENFQALLDGKAVKIAGTVAQHRTILRDGLPGPREVRDLEKRSKARYDKREQAPDGRTRPVRLVEW